VGSKAICLCIFHSTFKGFFMSKFGHFIIISIGILASHVCIQSSAVWVANNWVCAEVICLHIKLGISMRRLSLWPFRPNPVKRFAYLVRQINSVKCFKRITLSHSGSLQCKKCWWNYFETLLQANYIAKKLIQYGFSFD